MPLMESRETHLRSTKRISPRRGALLKGWRWPAGLLLLALLAAACRAEAPPPTQESILPIVPQGQVGEPLSSADEPEGEGAEPYPAPAGAEAEPAPQEGGQPSQAPYPALLEPARDVTVPAGDGLDLVGTLYAPQTAAPPWPGVLMLHMLGSDRRAWDEAATALASAGYAVLTLDMRGHGQTGSSVDWDLAADDLQHAWRYLAGLPEVDEERTAVVGASIGANLALITGSAEATIRTVVLLSPGLDYRGVTTVEPLEAFGERPLLIVASREDSYAASSSQTLSQAAAGQAELVLYDGAGHGTNMLAAEPGLLETLTGWLNRHTSGNN